MEITETEYVHDIRGEEKTERIYIVLTHSGTIVSKAIKRYTKKQYSHVAISLDADLKEMYSFGRRYKYAPLPGGFVTENFQSGFYQRFNNTEYSVYEVAVTKKQVESLRKNLQEFVANEKDYGYNVLGLISSAFDIPIERDKDYFCSQFVAYILQKSNIQLVDKPPGITEPMDFLGNIDVRMVYEGCINAVKN